MIGRANSDADAKPLKSHGNSSVNPMTGNHGARCPFAIFERTFAAAIPAIVAAAKTPRGGHPASEGLPPSERPFRLSGQSEVEN
jgi:hypothetical protein